MNSFKATAVSATTLEDGAGFVVVLAEHADGTGRSLALQRARDFDAQDSQLGMDTYCLSAETGATHYGGVVAWTLGEKLLTVTLDANAAQELDVEGGFNIEVALMEEQRAELLAGLQRVLGTSGG